MRLNPPKPPKAPSESDHPPDSIPAFDERGFLPEGFHTAPWAEVAARFGQTEHRRKLLDGLQQACLLLHRAGVEVLYLNGSFITAKLNPNDYDVCWDMEATGIDFSKLPVCMHPRRIHTVEQKELFQGEFHNMSYLTLYQTFGTDPQPRGVVVLPLATVTHHDAY